MITPRFACSQTESSLVVVLHVPSIRARDVEVHAADTLLSVHVNPYFLRLVFEGTAGIVDDDESSARYDPSSGDLTVTVSKQVKGEHFKDLDLLPKLLAPEGSKEPAAPLIEVLDEEDAILQAAENDWQLPQEVPQAEPLQTGLKQPYGFLDLHSGFFTHVAHTENDVNVLGVDVETLSASARRGKLVEADQAKWDEEYYMMDFVQDEEIQAVIEWEYPFRDDDDFSEDEKLAQLRLPRREYLIDAAQQRRLHLTLVTILFSYFYDARATGHDPTTESAWTISALTPCFVALCTHGTLHEAVEASYRRALCYPLYRSWALCERVRNDVASVLARGQKAVLRVLLETNAILAKHDVYYVYGKIWVEDYCVWVSRHASAESLAALSEEVRELAIDKGSIGWPLEELELAAKLAQADIDSDDE